MTTVKKNDFIELSFIGRLKHNNAIFDLTDEELAKKNKLYNPKARYGPKKICVGQGYIIHGLDIQLEGKEIGKEYIIEVNAKLGFGEKNSSLIKTVNSNTFKKGGLNPFPGLQINADGYFGTVRSVTGGRVVVDFNHPLAGRDLVYEIKILREIKEDSEKLKTMLLNELALDEKDYEIKAEGQNYSIRSKREIPELIKNKFISRAKELISSLNVKLE